MPYNSLSYFFLQPSIELPYSPHSTVIILPYLVILLASRLLLPLHRSPQPPPALERVLSWGKINWSVKELGVDFTRNIYVSTHGHEAVRIIAMIFSMVCFLETTKKKLKLAIVLVRGANVWNIMCMISLNYIDHSHQPDPGCRRAFKKQIAVNITRNSSKLPQFSMR